MPLPARHCRSYTACCSNGSRHGARATSRSLQASRREKEKKKSKKKSKVRPAMLCTQHKLLPQLVRARKRARTQSAQHMHGHATRAAQEKHKKAKKSKVRTSAMQCVGCDVAAHDDSVNWLPNVVVVACCRMSRAGAPARRSTRSRVGERPPAPPPLREQRAQLAGLLVT